MVTIFELAATFIIAFHLVIDIIVAKVMGPEGRFFLLNGLNPSSIFWGKDKTGHSRFYRVKNDGKTLQSGDDIFLYLPDLFRKDKLDHGEDNEALGNLDWDTVEEINEVSRTKAILAKSPLFTGDITMSLAAGPELQKALRKAAEKEDNVDHKKFLEKLAKIAGDKTKTLNLVEPFDLDEITKYVSMGYTQRDNRESNQEGYIRGLKTVKSDTQMMIIMAIIFTVAIMGVVFILSR